MGRCLALIATLAGVGAARPADALTLTFELDDLEGAYTSIANVDAKTQSILVSTTQLFRATGLTLLLEADSDCAAACDPPSSFRFGFGPDELAIGAYVGVDAFEGHLDLSMPISFYRPALLTNGGLAFSLALGAFSEDNTFPNVVPSAPAAVTRAAVQIHGDFVDVPEPAATALALGAGLAAWRRGVGRRGRPRR
jgi:hypothetical protein